MGSKEEMQDWLLSVGIVSPVTKESAGALYHHELSRQLADFVKIPLERAGGIMNMIDIYCLFNRARGTELISPDDLLRACSLWEKFNVPVMLKKFESGVMVIQNKSHSDEEVFSRIRSLVQKPEALQTGVSATDAARTLGRKHHQQIEQGDFSGCLSPTALESAEPFDHIPFGARMFNHEMMLRRKLEERELQHAIEFQDRRLMNLQLTDLKNHQLQRSFSLGVACSLPTQMNHNQMFLSDGNDEEPVFGVKNSTEESLNSGSDESDSNVPPEVKEGENSDQNETDKHESLEHALPDNLFASPTKSAASDHEAIFSTDMPDEPDYGAAISMNVTSKCQAIEM